MKPSVLVRPCRADDLKVVLEIERRSFSYPYGLTTFRHYLSRKEAEILVAELERNIVGYSITDVRISGRGMIVSIAVHPDFRRNGIGSLLLSKSLESLMGMVREVELQVAVDNESAQAFYRKHGFEVVDLLRSYYPDGQDAFLMRKKFLRE